MYTTYAFFTTLTFIIKQYTICSLYWWFLNVCSVGLSFMLITLELTLIPAISNDIQRFYTQMQQQCLLWAIYDCQTHLLVT